MQRDDFIRKIREYLIVVGPMTVSGLYDIFARDNLTFAEFNALILKACNEKKYLQTDRVDTNIGTSGRLSTLGNIYPVG